MSIYTRNNIPVSGENMGTDNPNAKIYEPGASNDTIGSDACIWTFKFVETELIECSACKEGIQTRNDGVKIVCPVCNGSGKWRKPVIKEDTKPYRPWNPIPYPYIPYDSWQPRPWGKTDIL